MLRSKRFAIAFALGIALVVPAAAVAVSGYATHPSDSSWGYVRPNNATYWACDGHVDGHRARLHYWTRHNFHHVYYSAWAPSQGCTEPATTTLQAPIVKFRICVEEEGCGPPRCDPSFC